MKKENTMYDLVINTITPMSIGHKKTIPIPNNLPYFRKYLSEISKRTGKKFTTKITEKGFEIMRIKYSNIYSKEVE